MTIYGSPILTEPNNPEIKIINIANNRTDKSILLLIISKNVFLEIEFRSCFNIYQVFVFFGGY